MVMVPKPKKPIDLIKSWRPIVLNTVGKLAQNMIADCLQLHQSLFQTSNTEVASNVQPLTP